jgi:hypothetical protein
MRLRLRIRSVARYNGGRVGIAQAEPWKADHDSAMRSFEMEEIVAVGNMAYQVVSYIDVTWQEYVAAANTERT